MRQRIYAVLIASALFSAAALLSGCGSTGSGSPSIGQNQAAKAEVTIAAKFPTADGAVKSLIPAGAQAIEVYAQPMPFTYDPINPSGTLIATLTPTEQSKTVQIAPGMYMVFARAYDSTDPATRTIVGETSTGGEVKSGQANTIILTFLDGQWTIVNASDVPSPLVLSDGTQLIDFIVESGSQPLAKAGKSSIDFSKPVGGGSGAVKLRFNNNTSARAAGWMASQFVGTLNSTLLGNDGYNLTKKCGFDTFYGLPCEESAGDQIVMISGKDNGGSQSGNPSDGSILYGSAESLLPSGGVTTFTQNGLPLDLMAALPDTTITGGTIVTGGVIEWKPSTDRTIVLGTPVAKVAKGATAIKAQSTNTPYVNITVKDVETIVCSGTNPQNRGTWSFANNTSAGKVVLGSRVCYTNYPYVNSQFDPILMQNIVNAGDYSYGLVPADTNNLGDYCHQWDSNPFLPYDPITNPTGTAPNPNYNKACLQQLPGSGDVYQPWNFRAVKSASKTTISYGSFKFNFWGERNQTGTAYVYPFRAKGSTTVTPAQ